MKITKTTKNMAERRGMTVYVGDEMQCITIALAGEQSDCFIMYKIKDGVLFSYCCTIQQTIQLSDFPAIIRTEAELRAKLDAIRSALYDIMKYGNVVEPAVVEPAVVEPAVVEVPQVLPRLVNVGDDCVPESQAVSHLADVVEGTLSDLPENSAVKTVLATVLALLRSPVPKMHEFPAEPALGTMIIETDFDFSLEFRNDVYCGRFILRDVTRTELHQLHAAAIELTKGYKAYELLQALSVIVSIPERSRNGAITGNRGVEWFSYIDN